MKQIIITILCLSIGFGLFAQESGNADDFLFQDPPPSSIPASDDDIIKVNFEKKDARRAMLYSAILPGLGQYYANPSAITTYIFPVLEVAMIGGIIYFTHQGNEKTQDYEYYATTETVTQTFNYTVNGQDYSYTYTGPRYNRDYQNLTQSVLKNINAFDIYDDGFFRLDTANTQHFYEDIGKYNKYVFGWADWFHNFATDPTDTNGSFILDDTDYAEAWIWTGNDDPAQAYLRRWTGNISIEDFMNGNTGSPVSPSHPSASAMRADYISMRNEAKDMYGYARLFGFGLALNHLASAVDAIYVTNRVNRTAISQTDFRLQYYTDMRDSHFTPSLGIIFEF
jgi:hypothetical protein